VVVTTAGKGTTTPSQEPSPESVWKSTSQEWCKRIFLYLVSSCSPDYNDYDSHLRGITVSAHKWTVAEAKAKFSEVVQRAESQGPQTITRRGRSAAVVVAAGEWQRKTTRHGNLAEFFAASPLRGSGLRPKRFRGRLRKNGL
jgi:prevent-host-death family protein